MPRTPPADYLLRLADLSNIALIWTDRAGLVVWVNASFTKLTGYALAEIEGHTVGSVLQGPETDPVTVRVMRDAIASGRGFSVEVRNYDRTGLPYWSSVDAQPMHDASGEMLGYLAIKTDITLRRLEQDELRVSRERLRLAMAGAGIGIWDADLQTGQLHVNDRTVELLGAQHVPLPWTMEMHRAAMHPDDREKSQSAFQHLLAGASPMYEQEVRVRVPGGEWRWVLERGRVVERDAAGAPVRVTGTVLDIDDATRASERLTEATILAQSANRAKSEFIANMSHEIRTPLNAIIGMTDLLAATPLDAAQRDYVQTIGASNEALLGIVNDVLDFSRIDAGRLEVQSARFDPWQLLEGVLEQFTGQAFARGLTLGCVIARDVPHRAMGDAARIGQVMLNLVGNAVKFTERGSVMLRLSVAGDGALRFDVEDTGVGFDAAKFGELLEPFRQADGSVTRRFGGSGLGLAISQRLVTLMGGRLEADSVPGRGSRFRVELPLVTEGAPPLPATAGARVAVIGAPPETAKILDETVRALGGVLVPVDPRDEDSLLDAAGCGLVLVLEPDPAALLALLDRVRRSAPLRSARLAVLWSPMTELPFAQLGGTVSLLALPLLPSELIAVLEGRSVEEPRALEPKAAAAQPQATRGVVLVVEDNVANQKVARGFLNRLGWAVEIAQNGREAVDRVQRQRYDAILMDCQMPVMNGFVATERIRRFEGTERHTPIIAMTAGASTDDRARCFEAGMDDYIAKPVHQPTLEAALARWASPSGDVGHDLVDREVLGRLAGVPGEQGGDLIGELIDLFTSRAPGVAQIMRDEARQGRLDRVLREAHGLKGTALTLGATVVAERCRAIETEAREGRAERIPELVSEFDRAALDVLPQLRTARRWILDADAAATSPSTE